MLILCTDVNIQVAALTVLGAVVAVLPSVPELTSCLMRPRFALSLTRGMEVFFFVLFSFSFFVLHFNYFFHFVFILLCFHFESFSVVQLFVFCMFACIPACVFKVQMPTRSDKAHSLMDIPAETMMLTKKLKSNWMRRK